MLTSCVNSNLGHIVKRILVLGMNISGLVNIPLRLLSDENSTSRVNVSAVKGLMYLTVR